MMASRSCEICGSNIEIPQKEWKLIHNSLPLFCSKECLLEKIKSFHKNGPRDYDVTANHICMCEGNIYSKKVNKYFRSRYEAKVAEFLKAEGIEFEYEPFCFRVRKHTYVPDFYLPENDCFIEVKGYFGLGSKSKLSRFLEDYPTVNLIMIPWTVRKELGY